MRDSTELAALQGQLSSHKSVTDTLRAQTHEFANQLHTISGLVQLGEYDAVRELVGHPDPAACRDQRCCHPTGLRPGGGGPADRQDIAGRRERASP